MVYCGLRHNLIFEVEVITDGGKVKLERNLSDLYEYEYQDSPRYGGYKELALIRTQVQQGHTIRFVNFLEAIEQEIKRKASESDAF